MRCFSLLLFPFLRYLTEDKGYINKFASYFFPESCFQNFSIYQNAFFHSSHMKCKVHLTVFQQSYSTIPKAQNWPQNYTSRCSVFNNQKHKEPLLQLILKKWVFFLHICWCSLYFPRKQCNYMYNRISIRALLNHYKLVSTTLKKKKKRKNLKSRLVLVLNLGFVTSVIFRHDSCKIFSESNTSIKDVLKAPSTCRGYNKIPTKCSTELN